MSEAAEAPSAEPARGDGAPAGHPSRRALITGSGGADRRRRRHTRRRCPGQRSVVRDSPTSAVARRRTDDRTRRAQAATLAYRAASAQLAAGETPPAGAVLDTAQIISDYVESFHEGLEEAYVFPRVAADGQHAGLVKTLLTQHDRGRHLTAAITTIAGAGLGPAANRTTLQRYLDQFVAMYEPHEAWEDTVIYPALRAATPQRTLDDLADRFAQLENTQYNDDGLAVILDRVSGVEEQLGIADLATFTPPALT